MFVVPLRGLQSPPRHVERNLRLFREALHLRKYRTVLRLVPWIDRPVAQRLGFIRNHQVEIEVNRVAKSLAARASSVRIIERKQTRLRILVAASAVLAFEAL